MEEQKQRTLGQFEASPDKTRHKVVRLISDMLPSVVSKIICVSFFKQRSVLRHTGKELGVDVVAGET